MDLENFFISQFYTKIIGDDGALIGDTVYSKDAFFQNVHFKREWLPIRYIAHKAMLVNISDAIAMNATPRYALLSVAMPKDTTPEEARELARGFQEIATRYGIRIIGGDTIQNDKLDITVTLVSTTKRPLLRKGLKIGDYLAYTGTLGESAKALRKLRNGAKVHKRSKFISLELRREFVYDATRYLCCGMDISDGLFSDLEKLLKHNGLGCKFMKKIDESIGCSGEEYEMLIGFDKRRKKAIIRRAKRTRTPLRIFAVATRKRYENKCKGHHF